MNDSQNTPTADQPNPAAGDLAEKVHEAEEQGYFGEVADKTPNEAYSMEGGAPTDTPESPQNKPAADSGLEADADTADDASGAGSDDEGNSLGSGGAELI